MCTAGGNTPDSLAEALRMAEAAADYLNGPAGAEAEAASLADVLMSLGRVNGKFAAVRAAFLARFDAERGYTADGYGSCTAWLKARGQMTGQAAGYRRQADAPAP